MSADARLKERLKDTLEELADAVREYDANLYADFRFLRRKASLMASLVCLLCFRSRNQTPLLSHFLDLDLLIVPSAINCEAYSDFRMPLALPSVFSPRAYFSAPKSYKSDENSVPFQIWWETQDVLGGVNQVSRMKICKIVRDKDGYGHVDNEISDEEYLSLHKAKFKSMSYRLCLGGAVVLLFGPEKVPLFVHKDVPPVNSTSPIPITQELPLENALAATIRCIAGELLAALDLPRLF